MRVILRDKILGLIDKFYNANTALNRDTGNGGAPVHYLVRRAERHSTFFVVAACLIPVLVILSGIFAGLTLGYMSLDETQLTVLASSGTQQQREYAKKIIPVRKNGHLLLVSLLLANMVVNESLPVISDQVLGGGVAAVAVSTVLIVIFSEIIPQSICSRYGLYIGAKCAIPVRILMYSLWIVAWPVSKLLEAVLGPHHGIIYRRAELKELINLHSNISPHGGDLKHDTVTIIGHTLDLQEKVVKDAMTPIDKVFMLPIGARLDYATLRRVYESGHSRVPIYEEVEIKVGTNGVAKRIVGVLLVKQCVLLDPQDETPLRSLPLNKIPSIPFDEPLLTTLDRFQEGRSHMAIVSLFSNGRAASVREAAKTGLTRRFLKNVGLGEDELAKDFEKAWIELREGKIDGSKEAGESERPRRFTTSAGGREQAMPADAVLTGENADEFLKGIDTHVNPLGIITLEDVLEELIGEEIYDEFDLTGPQAASKYIPPAAIAGQEEESFRRRNSHAGISLTPPSSTPPPAATPATTTANKLAAGIQFPKVHLFGRSRSQPGTPRSVSSAFSAPATAAAVAEKLKEQGIKEDTKDHLDDDTKETDTTVDGLTLRATSTLETDSTLMPDGSVIASSANDTNSIVPGTLAQSLLPTFEEDRERKPSAAVSYAERGRVRSTPSTPRGRSPATRAGVTEAILKTQTRRRASQVQSASNLGPNPTSTSAAAGATAGADSPRSAVLPLRQAPPKGRFKSSPLITLSPLAPVSSQDEDSDKDKDKDKDRDGLDSQGKDGSAAGIIAWNEQTEYHEQDDDLGLDYGEDIVPYLDPDLKEPKEGL